MAEDLEFDLGEEGELEDELENNPSEEGEEEL